MAVIVVSKKQRDGHMSQDFSTVKLCNASSQDPLAFN